MKPTKTEQISSGLVAVAWIAPSNYEWPSHFISLTEIRNGEPLVRLSDAEAIIAKQSAALKLAREAFSAINTEAKTFMSYGNARNNFSDSIDERNAYEQAMIKASELTKKALAAIDALGEVK